MPPTAPSACPLCGGATSRAFTTRDRNRAITAQEFRYVRCLDCRVTHLENVPDDLSRFYPPEYFARPSIDELRLQVQPERYRLEFVTRNVVAPGRIIEIGPGDGLFAIQAIEAGFEVTAIEPDPSVAAHLRELLGMRILESAAPEDVLGELAPAIAVVALHVIEHVPDPWALLAAAAATLQPGGVIVISTPNPRAFGFRVLGARWPHVDAPRHLFLLPHEAIVARGRTLGLEPVQLTATDNGGLGWNAFAWRYALRKPGVRWARERAAHIAGDTIAAALVPIERHGLRGAAYTLVLRKTRSADS